MREQAITLQDGALDIDATKDDRFGDKALVRDADYSNFDLESDIKILKGAVDGDLIFRVKEPAIGIDSFKGYVAAINVNGYVELGRTDGKNFTSLSKIDMPVNKDQSYRLKVVADGDHIQVFVDGEKKIDLADNTYSNGQVSVRAVTSNVRFDNFEGEAAGCGVIKCGGERTECSPLASQPFVSERGCCGEEVNPLRSSRTQKAQRRRLACRSWLRRGTNCRHPPFLHGRRNPRKVLRGGARSGAELRFFGTGYSPLKDASGPS